VVTRRQADEVVDNGPGVGPEAQGPALEHAALAVADDVDLPPSGRVHLADRVNHILSRDLGVAHGVIGQGDRAVGDTAGAQRRLVAPRELLRGKRRPGHE